MPELPEVETMVRGVRDRFLDHVLVDIRDCPCRCRPILISPEIEILQAQAWNRRVVSVHRRAKRIVITLETGSAFVIEPRMTGLLLVDNPPDPEHLRLEWKLKSGRRRHSVWFWDRRGLGTVQLLSAAELQLKLGPGKLGQDALELSPSDWHALLRRTERSVKVALLDQKLVAGIGNLYSSEILHRAGIRPTAVSSSLSFRRITRLQEATLEILHNAIRYEGSTLGDGTYRNALNQNGGYQNQHRVYDKAGDVCVTCGRGTIKRIVQAQRSTFYCPSCQR